MCIVSEMCYLKHFPKFPQIWSRKSVAPTHTLCRDLLCLWNKCCQKFSPCQLEHRTASPASLQNRISEELSCTHCIMCKAYGALLKGEYLLVYQILTMISNSRQFSKNLHSSVCCPWLQDIKSLQFSLPRIICFASASDYKLQSSST